MKVLIAPLNWGLGHATRCIPIIQQHLSKGDEVIIAAEGSPAKLLKEEFPSLRIVEAPGYNVYYSKSNSQLLAMIRSIPGILTGALKEHYWLKQLLRKEDFNKIISDNRFGMFSQHRHCIYITHQLNIQMPSGLKWLEPFVRFLHRSIIRQYNECWVPDFEHTSNLSGRLSHNYPIPANVRFIGPLSRFASLEIAPDTRFRTLFLISGPEPQRTLFEDELIVKTNNFQSPILMVRGVPGNSELTTLLPSVLANKDSTVVNQQTTREQITITPHIPGYQLAGYIKGAETIVARSGYSTIMDLHALDCLSKVIFVPTPGQTEQEYLATFHTQSSRRKIK
jgi:hypothetical protein